VIFFFDIFFGGHFFIFEFFSFILFSIFYFLIYRQKTIHMASVMENEGRIFAFDQSYQRYGRLKDAVERSSATCITHAYR